ncbi:hypothetical protein AVEN_88958-1 [Araneus ventricosus]|uniref:Uncharacterized protein n=1 Tax=Araneus ventricosus TaxID=182803 RepID=A0A4Y2DIK1_ARAVE|nr:hypothetical protein AVEN_88958-1 [Araneus ventricosus]
MLPLLLAELFMDELLEACSSVEMLRLVSHLQSSVPLEVSVIHPDPSPVQHEGDLNESAEHSHPNTAMAIAHLAEQMQQVCIAIPQNNLNDQMHAHFRECVQ